MLATSSHTFTHVHTHTSMQINGQANWCCFKFTLLPCVEELQQNFGVLKISLCRMGFITACTIPAHTCQYMHTHPIAHSHKLQHPCAPPPHHPLISPLTDLLSFHVKYLGCIWQVWWKLPWRKDFIYLTSTSSELNPVSCFTCHKIIMLTWLQKNRWRKKRKKSEYIICKSYQWIQWTDLSTVILFFQKAWKQKRWVNILSIIYTV